MANARPRACKVALEGRRQRRRYCRMRSRLLRFVLLRVLPKRLVPILTVIEIVRMVRRLRRG